MSGHTAKILAQENRVSAFVTFLGYNNPMHTNLEKLSKSPRAEQGFTLIELSIVLGIAGIIIAGVIISLTSAMQSQRDNRLSQQVISIIENGRNYARHVDSNNLALTTQDFCNLGLLPKDIGGANTTPCAAAGGNSYTDALGGSNYIDTCAAGGANTLSSVCGATAAIQGVGVFLINIPSSDCGAVLTNLAGNNPTDLGFVGYVVNGNQFPTSTASNLSLLTIGGANACGAGNTVNLEIDFTL